MSKFKVGDSIVPNNKWTPDLLKSYKLDESQVYIVSAVYSYDGLIFGGNSSICLEGLATRFDASYFNLFEVVTAEQLKPDAVNSPKHYSVFENVEAIQVIASSMTQDQFYGYCLGNILKYRLRAGGKDDVMQELGKADKYQELYNTHKHLCKEQVL